MRKIYSISIAILLFALNIFESSGQYPGSGQVPLDPTTIPQFVDFLPHFAGLRVNAKAGGSLIIEAVMTQQVAVSTGTELDEGKKVGTDEGAGLGNYFVYRISKDGGKNWTLPLWPAFTIEAQRGKSLKVEVRNELYDRTYADVNITADQTVMMSGVPLTGDPMTEPYTGPVPIALHLHGGEVQSTSDGGPHAWFTPGYALTGKGWEMGVGPVLTYPNKQEAATLWYHEHSQLGLTRINVYAGMAGFYFLRGTDEEVNRLPGWSGDDLVKEVTPAGLTADALHPDAYLPEIEIAIQDRMFDTKGQLFYEVHPPNPDIHPFWTPEFFGDVITVNGKSWPYLSVAPRKYRFHLLDGSNARFYNMWLENLATGEKGPAITQIGTDGGLLDAPAVINPAFDQKLLMGPGERADVVIDFSKVAPGTVLTLKNDANAPFPDGEPVEIGTTDRIMQFVVNGVMIKKGNPKEKGNDKSQLPSKLRTNPLVKLTNFAGTANITPDVTRQLTLNEVQGDGGPKMVLLNNSRFENIPEESDMFGDLTEKPSEGTTEKWQLINLTVDAHPMHMHLVQFQLVSRQDFNANVEGSVGYWSDYMTELESKSKMGGGGPPNDYNTLNADGAVGGNLPVSGYLQGPVIPAKPNERGWKDVIVAYPGQVTTYMVRFAPTNMSVSTKKSKLVYSFDPSQGPGYVWHCHIVEHEDNDMMRPMVLQSNISRSLSLTAQTLADTNPVDGFILEQNTPNPFTTSTEIRFSIPYDCQVQLKLFNSLGVEVSSLVDANLPASSQSVILTADNLSTGIYFYQLKAGPFIATRTLIINK